MSNLEEVFIKFLKSDPEQSQTSWDVDKWQEFFKKHAVIRTICFNCTEKILDHHRATSIRETEQKRERAEREKRMFGRDTRKGGSRHSTIVGHILDGNPGSIIDREEAALKNTIKNNKSFGKIMKKWLELARKAK